jgi:TIGR03009 family protein
MRRAATWILLWAAPAAVAQSPAEAPKNLAPVVQPPAAPIAAVAAPVAVPAALTAHLNAWQARHAQITSLYTECDRVIRNKLLGKEKAYSGTVMCLKPNLAWMKLDAKANTADFLAYICDGNSVFEYEASAKTVTEHKLPKSNPNSVGDNLLIEFMSGSMTAADVIKRFDLTLQKEEEHYVHIDLKPRQGKDMQEFESMLLVLYGPKLQPKGWDYLPAVVVMRRQNGQEEEQWTFKNPVVNSPQIKKEQFGFKLPAGWTKKDGPPPAVRK